MILAFRRQMYTLQCSDEMNAIFPEPYLLIFFFNPHLLLIYLMRPTSDDTHCTCGVKLYGQKIVY
jgi:hypothetical protein